MRAICIDNIDSISHKTWPLIIGKEYECIEITTCYFYNATIYKIKINDNWWFFPADNFKTLEEYRDKKLEEIGI